MLTIILRMLILIPVLVASTWVMAGSPPSRPLLSLDGEWQFRLDPKDEGEAGKWYDAEVEYPDRIKVPGNWQAQGFGEPRNHLRNDYQGKAWYRRVLRIPEQWDGKRIWIHLGGVTALGDIYVNGNKVGFVEHFLTPYEFDITEAVRTGAQNTIVCRVDSVSGVHDPQRDPIVRPGPIGMFNFWGHWGGLYRPVWLEARSDPAIDTLFVTSDIKKGIARAKVVLRRSSPGKAWDATLAVTVTPVKGGRSSSAMADVSLRGGQTESDESTIEVKIREPHLWSPEDPFLYLVKAVIVKDGAAIDVKTDRFGMREITTGEGGTLLMNGKPYFVRGLGDDYIELITGTLVPDKKVYLERIKMCKEYGYNGFRFLAHTPAKEVFEAADEAGFLIEAEAPAYGTATPRQEEVIPLYKKMVPQIIREFHNHPSWYAWSAANECRGEPVWMDYIHHAHETFKRMDPARLFIASEGRGVLPMDIVTDAKMFAATKQPFKGTISEVAYFKREVSDADLVKLAEPARTYPEDVRSMNPSGYWRLNEQLVGKVVDVSGNENHGVHADTMPADNLRFPGILPTSDPSSTVREAILKNFCEFPRLSAYRTGAISKCSAKFC